MLVSFENGFGQSLSYDLLLREVIKAMTCKGCRNSLIKLCHVLFSLILLDLSAMNSGTFANNIDMGKAVDCSRKLADKFREVLVACLVTLLTACRNAREDYAANLTTKLLDKHLCHALRHICMVSPILEIIDNLAVEESIHTDVLDTYRIIAQKAAQLLILLSLDVNLYHVHCFNCCYLAGSSYQPLPTEKNVFNRKVC